MADTPGRSRNNFSHSLERLRILSQTDITPQHGRGAWYAMLALRAAKKEGTAAIIGLTAGQYAIRLALLGDYPHAKRQLDVSYEKLLNTDPARNFAVVAIAGLRLAAIQQRDHISSSVIMRAAKLYAEVAEDTLLRQYKEPHNTGGACDRFLPMLYQHWAMAELENGRPHRAAHLATWGMYFARLADDEGNAAEDHAAFVAKHWQKNRDVLLLAATYPVRDLPVVRDWWSSTELDLLGNPLLGHSNT